MKSLPKKSKRAYFRLTEKEHKHLSKMAQRSNLSKSSYVREAMIEKLYGFKERNDYN